MKTKIGTVLVGVLVLAVVVGIVRAQSVPQLINYQGRLTDLGGQPLDGVTVDLTFAFYGVETGGTAYLTVLQEDVVVTGGIYNVLIGSGTITPGTESTLADIFKNHKDVWMGIEVNSDGEMLPRSRISSVPYALSALNMDSIVLGEFVGTPDWDGDSYLKSGNTVDCNDGTASIYPGAPELCDGIDNQCPGDPGYGQIDEYCNCVDNDGDGYGDDCAPGPDCNDGDVDNWVSCATCLDGDSDAYFDNCDAYTTRNGPDCDDGDSTIYPGAPELCDGVDNQCPGDDAGYGIIDEDACYPGTVMIPAGCFDMGDHFDEGGSNELPVHEVCITSDFYMDVHEVTNAEYEACVDAGDCTAPKYSYSETRDPYYGNPDYDNYPVIYVDLNQATDYCTWAGKRLPTEAEWEYAARGGLAGKRYPHGDTISCSDACYERGDSNDDCWDYGGLDNDTHQVGSYPANGYGLYDMSGNVWEWVNDWYQGDYYSVSPTNDPPGPDTGATRVVRGGAWLFPPDSLRVAVRNGYGSTNRLSYLGFRCARD